MADSMFLKLVQERGVRKEIDVQFVASHCGVVRNELADQAADQAFNCMKDVQEVAFIPLSAVKAMVKRHTRELDPLRRGASTPPLSGGGRSTKVRRIWREKMQSL
jgi:hypothetical protein